MQIIFFVAFLVQVWVGCNGFDFFLCSGKHYYLEDKTNRFTSVQFEPEGVVDCNDYGFVPKSQVANMSDPHKCLTVVDKDGMNSVMKLCPMTINLRILPSSIWNSLPKLRPYIFPGTRWCGAGNISDSENDVGYFENLDACCRTHDMCPDSIRVGQTKYGITNDKLGSISACECDDEFYECLQDVGSVASNSVGFTFFNVLAMPCFKEEYPIRECLEKGGLLGNRCQNYDLDTSKEPIYQLFDSQVYYSKSSRKK